MPTPTASSPAPASPWSPTSTPAPWSATCAPAASCAACSPPLETDAAAAGRKGPRHPHHGRPRPRQPRHHPRALRVDQAGGALLALRADRAAPPSRAFNVVAYDFGIKHNILRRLVHVGCRVTVVPSLTSAEDVLALKPDGIFLSNGPGDPEPLDTQVANIRKLIGKKPIFGICLGHQLLGLAVGGKTYKLKFGHRGANHPVRNEAHRTGGDHLAQSRLRGRPRFAQPQRRRDHPRQPERPDAGRLPPPQRSGLLRAIPPRGRARPARFALPVRRFRETHEREANNGCPTQRPPPHPDHRLRPHRHRPGLRVRLLRHPGRQGAARRRLRSDPGQFQPGHHHDRSRTWPTTPTSSRSPARTSKRSSAASGPTRCSPPWAARPA